MNITKDNRIFAYLLAVIALLTLVCLVGVILLATMDRPTPPTVDTTDTTASKDGTTASDDPPSIPTSAVLGESADYGQAYLDKILFLGDSTTYGLKYYGMLSGGKDTKQVWTPLSGTLSLDSNITKKSIFYPERGEEVNILTAMADKKPEYLIITLGVNGVSSLSEAEFKTYYKKLLNGVKESSPDTKIMLQSIFPVTAAYDAAPNGITNEKINTANTWVRNIAEECGVKYLDTCSVLKDADGCLILSYTNDSEMHLNPTGFEAELNYIRTHGYP